MNFLLRKYYNYLNNIDMVLLRTSYICTGTSSNTILDYNLVRFGVCMIKLRHERMLILRCILPPPPKKMNYLQKKVNPPSHHLKISNILTRNSSHWEYLNPMRNLKLLEKYQPPPPPPSKKKKISIYKKTKKTSLLVKVSTTLKLPRLL